SFKNERSQTFYRGWGRISIVLHPILHQGLGRRKVEHAHSWLYSRLRRRFRCHNSSVSRNHCGSPRRDRIGLVDNPRDEETPSVTGHGRLLPHPILTVSGSFQPV